MPPLLTLVAALISGEMAWAAAGPNPHAWQRWEHSLTSTRSYDNPNADVTLRVTYTGPDLSSFTGAMTVKWFNPAASACQNESVPAANAGSHTFVKPVAWSDEVLLLSGRD